MSDPLLHLDKVITTLKLNMLGEICKIKFLDGMQMKVDSERFGFRCFGKVAKMNNEQITIHFSATTEKFKNIRGLTVEISFSHNGEFYYFDAEILDQKDTRTIVIARPQEVKRTQRREYLRLPINVGIMIRRVDDLNMDSACITTFCEKITTKDLSGGGIRLESSEVGNRGADGIEILMDETIEKNSMVDIEIMLPAENITIKALGKIAWINRIQEKYEVGITFLTISKHDQDHIVGYLLNEQINRSKIRELKNSHKR